MEEKMEILSKFLHDLRKFVSKKCVFRMICPICLMIAVQN